MSASPGLIGAEERERYVSDGYLLRKGVFRPEELAAIREHYLEVRAREGGGGLAVRDGDDPLVAWPRIMGPHRTDSFSLGLMLDARTIGVAEELCTEAVLGAHTMWYWKAPGTRGQGLHQDEFYVRTQSGDCIAAWLPLDDTDADNGCLRIVPGSHRTDLQCPHEADPNVSFSRHEVDVPPGLPVIDATMAAGDVLYFHGRLIHGSMPNSTSDRWRRTFVGHYIPRRATACAQGYQPLCDAAGNEVWLAGSGPEADPCGGPAFSTAR